MSASKDLRKLLAELKRQQFLVIRTKKNHFKVFKAKRDGSRGQLVGTVGSTPSDWRSWDNTINDLRRYGGFTWKG